MVAWMRAWCAVPITNQIAVAPQREQGRWPRPHPKTGRQSEITAGGTADDRNSIRIDVE